MLVKHALEPHPWDHLPEWDWSARLSRLLMIELADLYEYFGGFGWELVKSSSFRQIWGQRKGTGFGAGIEISDLEKGAIKVGQTRMFIGRVLTLQKQPHELEFSLGEPLVRIPLTEALGDELLAIEAGLHVVNRELRTGVGADC